MATETFTEYGTEPLIERLRRSTIGRYDVYAELGSGGMASVFLALDLALERKVAIKVMSLALANSADAIERFRREAKVAAALSHPNIIGIHAVGDDPELAYYVMKFIEGRSLDSVIRDEGRQSITFTQAIIQYAGNALAYAHSRGVVHRDVKPANFMLDMDGWLVVTDFGIAKMEDAKGLTMSGTLVGTPYYMSPEQFDGSAITGAADQYALGVVAYEMLTGKTPFNATSLGEVMKGHLLDPVPPIRELRPDVPMEMEDCIQRMLAKKPGKRFPSLVEAVQAFGSIHPADERQIRTQIITFAKSGALLQPRMSVPASPNPTRDPARPQPRTAPQQAVAAHAPKVSAPSGRALMLGALLTASVSTAVLFVARPDLFARFGIGEAPTELAVQTPTAGAPASQPQATQASPAPATTAPVDTAPAVTSTPPQAPPAVSRDPVVSTPSASRATPRQQTSAPITTPSPQPTRTPASAAEQPPTSAPVPTGPGTIVIRSNIEGAVLYINGKLHAPIGARGTQTISLPAGEHQLSLQAEGCTSWTGAVTVRSGEETRVGTRSPTCG